MASSAVCCVCKAAADCAGGPAYVKQIEKEEKIKRRVKVPVAAIGGIKLENAPAVLAAGADMVAVVSDLFDAMDIKGRAAAFQKLFDKK